MQVLNESSVSSPLSDLQHRFCNDGYLFIRSFFLLDRIAKVRDEVLRVLESKKWGRWDEGQFRAIEPTNRINSPAFYECIQLLMQSEDLHDLSQSAQLCSLLSGLVEEPVFPHPRKMVRITYPYAMNSNDRTPPHQDIVYVKGERDTFTTWIPLADCPPEQGGLEVSPATHRNGLYPTQANSEGRFGCTAIEEQLMDLSWHCAHYRPGDLLIMHSLTLHRSGTNQTRQFRLSMDCRFSSALGTINEEQLLPPYYPAVAGWHELSTNWQSPLRFEPPSTIQIHAKEKDLTDVLKTPSKFAE